MSGKRGLFIRPTLALWQREMTRFVRQRNRIIGALATPLIFWLLIGMFFFEIKWLRFSHLRFTIINIVKRIFFR